MANFKVPSSPKTYTYSISDLLGVDYNDTVVDNRRSPLMTNLVNNNGFLESRNGHKILYNVDNGRINGVWNIDANDEIFVVHCGTKLYEVSSTFDDKVLIHSGMADVKSVGIYLNNELLILDGVRALVYHKVGDNWVVDYLDEIGYVPTVGVSLKPNGTDGESYEPINQCSPYQIYSYLSDGTSTQYTLPGGHYALETPTVTKLTSSGTTTSVTVSSWDSTTGKVTFASPIEKSPVDGRDNVFIKVKTTDVENYINACTFGTLFGYDGNNNRVFVSGNSQYGNYDWWCDNYVGVTYFPATYFAKIGTAPITAYSRANDGKLMIQKKVSDTDCTFYCRTSNMYNKDEVFPLSSGVKNIGCITHMCNCNFGNDPVFLSELGVYGLTGSSGVTDERFAVERSYYINRNLLAESNLEEAVATVNKNRYYLAVNGHVYMADKRFLSTTKLADTYSGMNGDYQYEWFYLTDIPVRVWFNWNGKLYFGDSDGNLRTFDNSRYYDEFVENGQVVQKPYSVYYETPFLYLDDAVHAKTVRRLYVHSLPVGNTSIKLSYKTADGVTNVSTITYTGNDSFPKVMQEKEKISKIMSCKLIVEGLDNVRCSFNSIIAEYRLAGKYRGE